MEIEIFPDGPFRPCFLLSRFPNLINSRVIPTSIGGNCFNRKYSQRFEDIAKQNTYNENRLYNISNLGSLNGSFFLIFLKNLDSHSSSQYLLSLVKVSLKFQEKEALFHITPLESHAITASTPADLSQKYQEFVKHADNGFQGNFFGKITIGYGPSEVQGLLSCNTFKGDFETLDYDDFDDFLFEVWSSIAFPFPREVCTLSLKFFKRHEKLFLPHLTLELSGPVHDYLASDLMILPRHLRSSKFSDVEEFSDFEDYSDSEPREEGEPEFNFEGNEFSSFFTKVPESIKKLGGSVLPYLNGSYLQDGSWMINNATVCTDLRDLILLLKGSTTWQNDPLPKSEMVNGCSKPKLKLVLYKVPHLPQSVQFRVFVFERQVVLISQLFFNHVYDYLLKDDCAFRLCQRIVEFYSHKLDAILPSCLSKFTLDLYIFVKSDEVYVTNIGTWNNGNDSLFPPEEIQEYLTSSKSFEHEESVRVKYFDGVALAFLLSTKLSRHKLYSFCSEDVEELAKLTCS